MLCVYHFAMLGTITFKFTCIGTLGHGTTTTAAMDVAFATGLGTFGAVEDLAASAAAVGNAKPPPMGTFDTSG